MAILRTSVRASLVTLTVLSSACQRTEGDDSAVQSLDNMAAGDTVQINSCSGSESDSSLEAKWESGIRFSPDLEQSLSTATKTRYKAKVKEYLTAVPVEFQKVFLNMGGQVLLTSKGSELCAKPFSDAASAQYLPAARQEIEGCMAFARGEGSASSNKSILAVVHQINVSQVDADESKDKNVERLKHSGVRVFGMAFSDFFARLAKNDNQAEIDNGMILKLVESDSTQIADQKVRMANAFLVDLARKSASSSFQLANLEGFIDASDIEKLRGLLVDEKGKAKPGILSGSVNALAGLGYKEARVNRALMAISGEALDSVLCSNATRKSLKDNFPESESAAEELKGVMLAHAKKIVVLQGDGSSLVGESSKALALQDFGGFGDFGEGTYMSDLASVGAEATTCNCANCANGVCACNCPNCQPPSTPSTNGKSQQEIAAAKATAAANATKLQGLLSLLSSAQGASIFKQLFS